MTFRDLAGLYRIPQWGKNLFVLAPAFFAFRMDEPLVAMRALGAFFAFGFTASGMYVLNDLADLESDRKHPEKRFRPLASGRVSPSSGMVAGGLALCGGFLAGTFFGVEALGLLVLYGGLNALYSWKLKHAALLDIFCIALGFVLRVLFGGLAAGVPLSRWIVIMTFLLALFLALGKRRGDLEMEEEIPGLRPAVEGYSRIFVDASMMMLSGVTLVAYLMYCLSPEVMTAFGTTRVYYSFVFVLFGILRYLQNVMVFHRTSPTKILYGDPCFQALLAGWIGFFLLLFLLR
jgi:4-hydroxybenzoate polyprenyltransferase